MPENAFARRALKGAARFVIFALVASLGFSAASAQQANDRPAPVERVAAVLHSFNAALTKAKAHEIAAHVLWLSAYYSLDPQLLVAIVGVESGWRPDAVSPVGAQGLGQLMPSTASSLRVQAFEMYENLDGTARYLRRLLQRYASVPAPARYELALAGYNAGPEAVARYHGIPPYSETRAYVTRVMALWHQIGSAVVTTVAKAAEPKTAEPKTAEPKAPVMTSVADPPVATVPPAKAVALAPVPKPAPAKPVAMHVDSERPISYIALFVPKYVANGDAIPISWRVHGSGTMTLVVKIGPKVIEQREVSSTAGKTLLKPLPPSQRMRLITLRATAARFRTPEAMIAAVGPATRSAFLTH